jgi:hypothetical protein
MYRAADAGATAAMLAKLSVEKSLGARLDETRLQLQSKVCTACKAGHRCPPMGIPEAVGR